MGVVLIFKIYFFCKRNPPSLLGAKFKASFTFRLIYFVCDTWSTYTFWCAFFVNFYWFVMYKMQDNAYLLLPNTRTSNAYQDFEYFFYAVLAAKTVAVLLQIIY